MQLEFATLRVICSLSPIGNQVFSLLSHAHLQSKISEVSFTEMKNRADYVKQCPFPHSTSTVTLDSMS